jgi:hypothetical protein
MGAPPQKADSADTEVWSYPSGGDTVTIGLFGSSYSMREYCVVNIVFSKGHVAAVNYTGRIGSKGQQCAFAVRNCIE